MKIWMIYLLLVFSSVAFAGVSVSVDYKEYAKKSIQLKETFETSMKATKTFKLPDSNREIDIKLVNELPELFAEKELASKMVLIDVKVYETFNGQRKVISSPRVLANWNEEASFESYKDQEGKLPLTSLKLTPKKL
jgi:hypothetical protein